VTNPSQDIELLRARLAGDRGRAASVAVNIFDDLTGSDDNHLVELRRAFVEKVVEEAFSPARVTEINELKTGLRLGGQLGDPQLELGASPRRASDGDGA
jgi:hypothetical protein